MATPIYLQPDARLEPLISSEISCFRNPDGELGIVIKREGPPDNTRDSPPDKTAIWLMLNGDFQAHYKSILHPDLGPWVLRSQLFDVATEIIEYSKGSAEQVESGMLMVDRKGVYIVVKPWPGLTTRLLFVKIDGFFSENFPNDPYILATKWKITARTKEGVPFEWSYDHESQRK